MERRRFLAGLAATAMIAGCQRARGIAIGSKNFTEQLILGELLAQVLEPVVHYSVERRFYLAGSYICHQSLLAGRIDMYVEYTGTALAAILKEKNVPAGHAAVYEFVKDQYARRFGLTVLPSLGFDNSFAIVMRRADALRFGISRLSQLAPFAPTLRMGVGYEFLERPDGYQGLAKRYGLNFAGVPRVMDLGLLYRALENHQVDVVAGSNTDGLIEALGLVVLEDDAGYFPPYDAVPIVRPEVLDRPGVAGALARLSGRISAEDMRRMNYAVDGAKKDAAVVVEDYIAQKQLVARL
ncbi:MAG TPA: glycine betaine ABC transporter substrate-binding protein [Terriglobales bacterium]